MENTLTAANLLKTEHLHWWFLSQLIKCYRIDFLQKINVNRRFLKQMQYSLCSEKVPFTESTGYRRGSRILGSKGLNFRKGKNNTKTKKNEYKPYIACSFSHNYCRSYKSRYTYTYDCR